MPRRSSSPPPRVSDWPPDKTYKALQAQIAALDQFRGRKYREVENDEDAWRNLTLAILTHGFGQNSNNVSQFHAAKWAGEYRMGDMSEEEFQRNFEKRIEAMSSVLKSSLAELEIIGVGVDATLSDGGGVVESKADPRRVFVVHGHDVAVTETAARFLERLGLEPIILHEQPNLGRTVIEKFEDHSDVGFALVLLTPDDVGGLASEGKLSPRSRQNVILELGYFIGKLGRARVCALYVDGVELPSDIHGVLYIPYDASGSWKLRLAHEIRAAGFSVDLNLA